MNDALSNRRAFTFRFTSDQLKAPGGYPVGELWGMLGKASQVSFKVPKASKVTVTLRAGASQIGGAPAPTMRLEVDGKSFANITVKGSAAVLANHTHKLTLSAGTHTLRYVPTNFVNQAASNYSNNILLKSLVVAADEVIPGPGRALVFTCKPSGAAQDPCPTEIIQGFAERAFRRTAVAGRKSHPGGSLHQSKGPRRKRRAGDPPGLALDTDLAEIPVPCPEQRQSDGRLCFG